MLLSSGPGISGIAVIKNFWTMKQKEMIIYLIKPCLTKGLIFPRGIIYVIYNEKDSATLKKFIRNKKW